MDFEFQDAHERPKWWQRLKKNIDTDTSQKLDTPDGVWYSCKKCKAALPYMDYEANIWCCTKCGGTGRIGSQEYFQILCSHVFQTNIENNDYYNIHTQNRYYHN
jgi:acetyl-CoA carboxylase carboxyl transferase subunit beta